MSLRTFISYSSKNREIAIRVRDAIHAWGYSTWMDIDEIKGGEYWPDDIQAGLEACQVVVGIITEDAVASREVWAEWNYGFKKTILILLRYEDVSLNYRWEILNYLDCVKNELEGLQRLKSALETPNSATSNLSVPAFIRESSQASPDISYQPLAHDSKPNNRAQMLENVYQTWILGVLKPNLQAGAFDLGLVLKADAVLKHKDYGEYKLGDSRDIARLFKDTNGELLILGEPGSGKTILMLQLAEQLLGVAQKDEKQPIPIVLNLASWGQKQDNQLEAWLLAELKQVYTVPEKQAKEWLDQEIVTLFLDGLDEIAPSRDFGEAKSRKGLDEEIIQIRSKAIRAINLFRKKYKSIDMVVCSRIRDYQALSQKVDFNSAILLQALSSEQIKNYLVGDAYAGLVELLRKERGARKLANEPYLLTMMKSSYETIPYYGSPDNRLKLEDTSPKERRKHLFAKYVEKQQDRHPNPKYPRREVIVYLQWLGYQMIRHKQTVFYIEDLQHDWGINQNIYGLLAGLLTWLPFGLPFGLFTSLPFGLFIGLGLGVFSWRTGGLRFSDEIQMAEKLRWVTPRDLLIKLPSERLLGLGDGPSSSGLLGGLRNVLIFGLVGGLIGGLLGGLLGEPRNGLLLGLLISLVAGLYFALEVETLMQSRLKPNSGLSISIKNGFFAGLSSWLLFGLSIGLISWPTTQMSSDLSSRLFGLPFGLVFGLLMGLMVGLRAGWEAVMRHIILRLLLIHKGYIPRWRYDSFLDYASEAGFLRKVGGGYIFRHRMLLEYFAEQYEASHKS